VSFDVSGSFLASDSNFSNAFFFVLANFRSEFRAFVFSFCSCIQTFLLARFTRDSSAKFVGFSDSAFGDCLGSASALGQESFQVSVMSFEVSFRMSDDSSYTSTFCMSFFVMANSSSNLLAVLADERFVGSNSLFPFCVLLDTSVEHLFLAFFLSFGEGSARFCCVFLAGTRNSSDLVFVKASSESFLHYIFVSSANATCSFFTSMSNNVSTNMMDSSAITFLEAFFLSFDLAFVVFSTFESSFG
jgi:hypothetical protein